MGGRRLRQWLERPLLDPVLIESRLETVDLFVNDLILRSETRDLLKSVYDLERLASKLVFGTINARDLLALKSSLAILPDLKAILSDADATLLNQMRGEIDLLEDVYSLIDSAIAEEPPISVKEGGLIRSEYNEDLAALRNIVQNGKQWILDLETRERQRTGIKTLKVGFNKVFGYYLDITRTNSHLAPEDYQRKQTLANSERYITPELKALEEKVLGAEERITGLEYELFSQIRATVLAEVSRLKRTADAVATIDVLTGLAELAYVQNYCRPVQGEPGALKIEGGRHPVIEKMFPKIPFIPNDAELNQDEHQFHIITGPNMAGKSTYLRQVALITLLYQIGSFVPADRALLSPVDRIFTRVGASDDLSQGQSTFMVEMIELSHILRHATPQSLILLDEIGRGTSTYDGLSIAWSVVEYLSKRSGIRAKTMFATHYHELTELEGKFSGVKNFCIAVREQGEDIVFLRKIIRGGANQSFGIQVARLAGLPEAVVLRARQILKKLEENDINNNIQQLNDLDRIIPDEPVTLTQQLSFLTGSQSETLVEEMAALDVLRMTPLEAMSTLDRLISEARRLYPEKGRK
jgi:DNA mismatch repair protein MutS